MAGGWDQERDYKRDLVETVDKGGIERFWPIYDDYRIENDVIKPAAGYEAALYLPIARQQLLYDLAKVPNGDRDAVFRFVSQWGLLGYDLFVPVGRMRGGDPLFFIWGHAYMFRNLLNLWEAIQKERLDEDFIDSLLPPPTVERVQGLDPHWLWLHTIVDTIRNHTEQRDRASGSYSVPQVAAMEIMSRVITENLATARPVFKFEVDAQIHFLKPPEARIAFDLGALVTVAYWHLANVISRGRKLARCRECGDLFEKKDSRQEFCPPPEFVNLRRRVGRGKRRQSSCGLRFRARRYRQKQAGRGNHER